MIESKIWFITVDGKKEGPYGILDLRRHPFFTPDTLVWRKGFSHWLPAREVPELQIAFEDLPEDVTPEENNLKKKVPPVPGDELIIDMREDPPPFYFLLLVAAAVLVFVFFQIIWGK